MEGLVLPSKIYGVLASGRPMAFIGDEGGEITALINENEVGFAVGHGDGAGLAEKIQILARDPEKLHQMGANARRLFETEYAMPNAIDRWRTLLNEVTST